MSISPIPGRTTAPIPAATMLGYQAEGARTNLCLQSNAFTTTWGTISAPTIAQNATGPDGGTTAWTITDDSGVASEGIAQAILLTAATHTLSVFVKKTTGAQASYPVVYAASATHIAPMTIDTSNGVATAWSAYTGFTIASGLSATCVSYNDDFWRCSVTFTASAANWSPSLIPAGTTNPTQSTGALDPTAQGSAVFYGAQVELGSFASSYIATTTIAVARNADVLTYSVDLSSGSSYAEVTPSNVDTANGFTFVSLSGGAANKQVLFDKQGGAAYGSLYVRNTTDQAFINIGNYTANTVNKVAGRFAANDFAGLINGGTVATDTNGTLSAMTQLNVSTDFANSTSAFGNIRNVRIWQRQLSASELQAVTS